MAQAADTELSNGRQSIDSEMTPERAKALHAQLNRFYRSRSGGKKKGKPVIKPRGNLVMLETQIGVEESPTDFDDITDEPFSLVPGSIKQIWVKTGKERMKCVNTGRSIPVGGAAVYRIFM